MLEASAVQVGCARFLCEYNLPIGLISGIYLNPTPRAPAFVTLNLAVRIRL